jgi:CO dehydrogenase maturation factor
MPKVIAVAGKGGVGKTTLCGMLTRYLVEEVKDGAILAVDADPNSNLNEVLGVEVRTTIGEVRERMKKDVPIGMTKDVWFEYKIQEAIIENKGFDLLVMGRPEGPGCYCAANTLAKQSIDTLKKNYAFVLVDNEAGMEHMSRLVTQDIDALYIVSDAGPRGVLTASRILALIGELHLNIKKTSTIINRLRPQDEKILREAAAENGLEITGLVRFDDEVTLNDGKGKSIFDLDGNNSALTDAYDIFRKTLI